MLARSPGTAYRVHNSDALTFSGISLGGCHALWAVTVRREAVYGSPGGDPILLMAQVGKSPVSRATQFGMRTRERREDLGWSRDEWRIVCVAAPAPRIEPKVGRRIASRIRAIYCRDRRHRFRLISWHFEVMRLLISQNRIACTD